MLESPLTRVPNVKLAILYIELHLDGRLFLLFNLLFRFHLCALAGSLNLFVEFVGFSFVLNLFVIFQSLDVT